MSIEERLERDRDRTKGKTAGSPSKIPEEEGQKAKGRPQGPASEAEDAETDIKESFRDR